MESLFLLFHLQKPIISSVLQRGLNRAQVPSLSITRLQAFLPKSQCLVLRSCLQRDPYSSLIILSQSKLWQLQFLEVTHMWSCTPSGERLALVSTTRFCAPNCSLPGQSRCCAQVSSWSCFLCLTLGKSTSASQPSIYLNGR